MRKSWPAQVCELPRVYGHRALKFAGVIALFLGLMRPFPSQAQFYYGSQQQFGKNRVQYQEFLWSYYRFERFDAFYYKEGQSLAEFASRTANAHLTQIEKFLDHSMDERIEIIVFNNLSDFKQSNIGLQTSEEEDGEQGTPIATNKIFLYYNGNHHNFTAQVRAGIARAVIHNMVYGASIQEAVRGNALVDLPSWFTEGLISFLSRPWDADLDAHIRDGILHDKYAKFNRVFGDESTFLGHSLWNYIASAYGGRVIPHIVYMTILNRKADHGFMFVLGADLQEIVQEWRTYYELKYEPLNDLNWTEQKLRRSKNEQVLYGFQSSPWTPYQAWISNDLGRSKVLVWNEAKGSVRRIYVNGYRTANEVDYSQPLLAWHPDKAILCLVFEEEGIVNLGFYNVAKNDLQVKPLFAFSEVTGFTYSPDGSKLLFSAVVRGQTDIYEFDILSNSARPITQDPYDDLYPVYLGNSGRQIAFTSDRSQDSTRQTHFDIYWVRDITEKWENIQPIAMTQTPDNSEMHLNALSNTSLSFLSRKTGTSNRFTLHIDSAIAYVDTITHYRYEFESKQTTDARYNLAELSESPERDRTNFIVYKDGRYELYRTETPISGAISTDITTLNNEVKTGIDNVLEYEYMRTERQREIMYREVDIQRYLFGPLQPNSGSEIPRQDLSQPIPQLPNDGAEAARTNSETEAEAGTNADGGINKIADGGTNTGSNINTPKQVQDEWAQAAIRQIAEVDSFELPKARNFVTSFFPKSFSTQIDNSFINQSYQRFTGGGALFLNPAFNGLFTISMEDLMENFELFGAFRLSANLDNNEIYLGFRNRKSRMDKETVFLRRGQRALLDAFTLAKVTTHEVTQTFTYPFNEVFAAKGSIIGRMDQQTILATDNVTIDEPNAYGYWAGAKVQLIFDNTIALGQNLRRGARGKLFSEIYQDLNNTDKRMITAGFDVRAYTRVHRTIIWANRVAGGTSFGPQRLAYFMGGTDNWFVPRYDNTTPIDYSQNFAFQTLATPLRGFDQNIRNGTSFMVLNSELRIPVIRYLINRPLRSNFLNNLQLVGFADVGTAWTGPSPYSSQNFLNEETIEQGNISVTINTQVEPVVAGFGYGLRSELLGYFVKADWGYGWEDGVFYPPRFYFSLGLDF